MELLLVSGLLGEAAWFASRLGDWKIAFLLAVTEGFRQKSLSFVRKKSDDDHVISVEIPEPEQIMKERINIILKLDERITVGYIITCVYSLKNEIKLIIRFFRNTILSNRYYSPVT